MNLPTFCIKRPAFTIVICLVMTIVGLIGFMNLPIRWIPNVNLPVVTIQTIYPGANAKLVEKDVTKVLEGSISGINGIETLTSRSRQDSSQIMITFKLGTNMNAAVEDVRGSIETARGLLPRDVENPIVAKSNTEGMPILYLTFYHPSYNARELSDYVDKYVVPAFETVDGVGQVQVLGKRITAMRVSLDPAKMAGAKVTVDEVVGLLRDQNASIPSGRIRSKDRFYSVVTDTTLKTAEQFNNLIIHGSQQEIVRLRDIGEAKWEEENVDSDFRVNGKSAVGLGIIAQSTANPLEVEQAIKKKITEVTRSLPKGMQARIDFNQADYIRSSMHSVYESFFEAILFVWLVIFAFLCSFRATIIPIITIPVCVITTFALLYFLGFSINTITLMAFVLAIGLVVDDAIVVLENISRHIEEGLAALPAAIAGSREIVFPIIAMTLTLAAVYTPIAFTPGLLGVLFREFTFTLAGAVIVSGIVALTLSPMMCASLLKPNQSASRYQTWMLKQLASLQIHYQRLLTLLLQKRKWVLGLLLIVGAIGYGVYKWLPTELAPTEDMSQIEAMIAAPRGASFQYTDSNVKQFESLLESNPEVESYLSIVGLYSPSHSYQIIKLKPKNERHHSMEEILQTVMEQGATIPGARVNAYIPPPPLAEFAGGDMGDNVGIVIMTTSDYRKLQQAVAKMIDAIKKIPEFVHVDNKLKWDSEQFQIDIDRDRAADLKVSIPSIANTISTLLASRTIGKIDDANIIVQMNESALTNPNIFQQIYVRNDNGVMLPLANVISVSETTTPEVFNRYERLRSDSIYVNLAPGFKVSDAINALEKIAKENLPDDMKYAFTGEAKSFLESSGKTALTFLLALVFIYLVLVAQFESFIDPFVILFTVPFAIVGAMLTLKLFGGSMNIYSNIGLITLVGLIAKHGILITEFANRLRQAGKSIQEAVIEASLLRLRPILMTTAAMILGALPLALAFGPGAESRQQIGLVVTGGLLFGTFFSLIVVPIAYTYLAPFRKLKLLDQEA